MFIIGYDTIIRVESRDFSLCRDFVCKAKKFQGKTVSGDNPVQLQVWIENFPFLA